MRMDWDKRGKRKVSQEMHWAQQESESGGGMCRFSYNFRPLLVDGKSYLMIKSVCYLFILDM